MNTSQAAANSKRIFLLTVLLGAFALVNMSAGSALAGGGVSVNSTESKSAKASKAKAKYKRLWQKVSKKNKRWANRTAQCESGRNPRAIGGGGKYRGAFQFLRSTWRTSPKSPGGDPIKYDYRTQAVVAVALKKRDGAGHWPVCG